MRRVLANKGAAVLGQMIHSTYKRAPCSYNSERQQGAGDWWREGEGAVILGEMFITR